MLFLHFGVALWEYTGINFSVEGVTAEDWFMFAGSYLGGAITLTGVTLTLRHERKIHQHQIMLEQINKEKELLSDAISRLDLHAPSSIFFHFSELEITDEGYKGIEVAEVRRCIWDKQRELNQWKAKLAINTDIYASYSQCGSCNTVCKLEETSKKISEDYERISNQIYDTLSLMDTYVNHCETNALKDILIRHCKSKNEDCQRAGQIIPYSLQYIESLENQKIDTKENQKKLQDSLYEINQYAQKEMPNLFKLIRDYYQIKCKNANNRCFAKD